MSTQSLDGEGSPLVSVVIPVHNDEKRIMKAVQSLLEQNYGNIEVLVVDDGSLDRSGAIVSAVPDPRVRLVTLGTNRGIAVALNAGIELAQGKYIARLDSDDESLANRLVRQVEFLERHPEVGVVGMGRMVRNGGRVREVPPWLIGDNVQTALLQGNPLAHPTVMIRGAALLDIEGPYYVKYRASQDYRLWVAIARKWTLANLPEAGVIYAEHPDQISQRRRRRQALRSIQIRWIALFAIGKYWNVSAWGVVAQATCAELRTIAGTFLLR